MTRQLAVKLLRSPTLLNVELVNQLRGNDPNEFTLAEHNRWVAKLRAYCRESEDC